MNRLFLQLLGLLLFSNIYSQDSGLKTISFVSNEKDTVSAQFGQLEVPENRMKFEGKKTFLLFDLKVRSPLKDLEAEFNETAKVKNGRSMGFSINYDTNLSYGHNGTSIGNSAELRFFPHSGYLMIVLCNNRSGAHIFFRFFNNNLPNY